ncbi:phosphatase PAP2 family protein [Legionella jordanis]|uniref:phosphatase PAP2 family protein n=1 Tax=Legionella jordanis TaxID=456 RepID=UPI000F00CFDE|nr:phosphatase PAP2 family protein [Legionella jordanis]RMX18239.1 phosphatase PAP2 family protein [Legionella jordanis]HAT8713261.1 phosphatase PAP2 family protein [Legionella jordanis]
MPSKHNLCTVFAGSVLFILSIIALAINHFIYKYQGNNYFPSNTLPIALLLFLALAGSYLQFGKQSIAVKISREIIFYFIVMSLIALATNAIQYTPFTPIDEKIINLEQAIHVNVPDILHWTLQHDVVTGVLVWVYDSLPYQMSLIPVFVILMRRFSYVREYYCLLLITALIGFSIYYFYPTVAPASSFKNPVFSESQLATGLKFNQIHQNIPPSTIEGGLIAFPSFHAIWAWLCLYLLRSWPIVFFLLLPVTVTLILSCVLLGWHYPLDLIASLIIVLMSHWFCAFCGRFKHA